LGPYGRRSFQGTRRIDKGFLDHIASRWLSELKNIGGGHRVTRRKTPAARLHIIGPHFIVPHLEAWLPDGGVSPIVWPAREERERAGKEKAG
jgi:hypothetical protein